MLTMDLENEILDQVPEEFDDDLEYDDAEEL